MSDLLTEICNLRMDLSHLRADMGNIERAIESQLARVRQTMAVNLEILLAAIAGKA